MKLSSTVGQPISHFCLNGFNGPNASHCAHFISHVLAIDAGHTCRIFASGRNPSASVRVVELFALSPEVGLWDQAPNGICLVFVTDRSNVDLSRHTMNENPNHHVGIFSDGLVYNYANLQDKVVAETPQDFLRRFQKTYGGQQVLFYGTLPVGALKPTPEAVVGLYARTLVLRVAESPQVILSQEGKEHFASINGSPKFLLGSETVYKGYGGLYQPHPYGTKYDSTAYASSYGTYAAILEVIAAGESEKHFNCLNTYDRAAFTFGVFQLAAHTPSDNLILLFRRLVVESKDFQDFFPDLKLVSGELHRVVGDHTVTLETEYPRPGRSKETNLNDFMAYLNADKSKVDPTELNAAAKLIYLANNNKDFNALQVDMTAQIIMKRMRNHYSTAFSLEGVSDLICAAIADIRHQSRGSDTEIRDVLKAHSVESDRVSALCKIGERDYASRCKTLKEELNDAKAKGRLGISVYDQASGSFRPVAGWPA
ncbi:hypothetical protein [Pseudomonas costantinii]|uniref:hypothetical protein n=1 Tax=Pseudomonas costantinii TaxID=168469 RepID=UPI0015A44EEC|nr:hypothetical protein [Pseudomonas costantinii]NVZ70965.1 hypothetical protein [Pseudomonas costantinii]